MAQAHAELTANQERLDAERVRLAAEAQHHIESLAVAEQALALHTAQLDGWIARGMDWEIERERTRVETERLTLLSGQDRAALDALREQYETLQLRLEQERTTSADHIRAVEDRAHAAVDTARQEQKSLRLQAGALQRDVARAEATLGRERGDHAKAKAQTLQDTLTTFRASLVSRQVKSATPRRRSAATPKAKTKG